MEASKPSKTQKLLAFLTGLTLAVLLCGISLYWFMSTGRFRQIAEPFAYAAQTVVVAPALSATPVVPPEVEITAGADVLSQPYSKRFELAGPYISEALGYLYQGQSAEEILAWDKVLEIIPEYAEAYYNRGQAHLKLLNNQRSQEEFLSYLSRAGEDFDKAIELAPYAKGDYYYGRFKYYDALASNQGTRVDFLHLESIALDNLLMANQLGNYQEDAGTKLALVSIAVGKCDEGIEQANRLIAETTEPGVDMLGSLSLGYLCRNDLPKALSYMDEVVKQVDNCRSRFDRARIFYSMGRLDDALADLDYTIGKDPNYCGIRYYLRGLIHAERGDIDKAEQDLSFGIGQTWERGGLLAYANGKIALAQGNEEFARLYFQEAENTYSLQDPIYTKILEDLTALGAEPMESSSSFAPATAIPTPTPLLTPRPISSPDPSLPTPAFTPDPILQSASVVDLEKPIEPVKLGWGFQGLWRFQPVQSLDHREVQRLSVWLISSDTHQRLPRQISLWNFRLNMWGGNNTLQWGENRINSAGEFVSPDGDVYVRLNNDDQTLETTIDTFGITLVLQRTDGSIEVHGITP
jgi:tetratricopeptide (TPR) repeat protein